MKMTPEILFGVVQLVITIIGWAFMAGMVYAQLKGLRGSVEDLKTLFSRVNHLEVHAADVDARCEERNTRRRPAVLLLILIGVGLALWLTGCAQGTPPSSVVTVRVYESRSDGSVTSATLTAPPLSVFGERRTTATLATPTVRVSVEDTKTKDTIGNLGAAGIGALAGWMILP